MGLPSFIFTRWQIQYMEREQAKHVLKTRFYSNYQYLTCYTGNNTQGSLEFIYVITFSLHVDSSIWFRHQLFVHVEPRKCLNIVLYWVTYPPKSSQWSPPYQEVNFSGSQHLPTTLCFVQCHRSIYNVSWKTNIKKVIQMKKIHFFLIKLP